MQGRPRTNKPFSDTNRVSENWTYFWHQVHRDGVRFQRLGSQSYKTVPPHTRTTSFEPRLLPVLLTDQITWEVPTIPALGLIFYSSSQYSGNPSTRSPVYYKRMHIKSSQMEEMHKARYVGRSAELPCPLQMYHFPQISKCSPTQKFSKLCPFGFLWRLHYIGMTD